MGVWWWVWLPLHNSLHCMKLGINLTSVFCSVQQPRPRNWTAPNFKNVSAPLTFWHHQRYSQDDTRRCQLGADTSRLEFTPVILVHVEERRYDDAVGELAAGEALLSLLTFINTAELDIYLKHAQRAQLRLERPQSRCTDHFSNIVAKGLRWVGMRLSAYFGKRLHGIVKIHQSQPNIYTLFWRSDLITRFSSEEAGSQFFRVFFDATYQLSHQESGRRRGSTDNCPRVHSW